MKSTALLYEWTIRPLRILTGILVLLTGLMLSFAYAALTSLAVVLAVISSRFNKHAPHRSGPRTFEGSYEILDRPDAFTADLKSEKIERIS